ncbi:MAG: tripartite tricarboxylate transporter TctB family protein [Thermodesulfobacteriota bacterium]
MTRVHQAACLIIFIFSIWVGVEAIHMNYYTSLGPGPGFFPFWLALFMILMCIIWFIQLWLKPLKGKAMDAVPDRAGLLRVAALIASTAVFGLLVEHLGFSLLMFAFLLFLLYALGRQTLFVTLTVSIFGSFGVYYVFTKYLNVHLPECPISFLRILGF